MTQQPSKLSSQDSDSQSSESVSFNQEGWDIRLIGYCAIPAARLLGAFLSGTLQDAEGQFVVSIENSRRKHLIASRFGVVNYFHTWKSGQFFHHDTVAGVVAAAGLDWEWDYQALGDMMHLEQAMNGRTLHPAVSRLLPGQRIAWVEGAPEFQTDKFDWSTQRTGLPANPRVALECFNEDVRNWATGNPAVLMTGGFDSRVILSSLLKQGIKPVLVVSGVLGVSTDVIVAQQIAQDLNLELRIATLTAQDFVDHGQTMALLTNGNFPLCHWSPYLYCMRWAIDPREASFVGVNGEFARSFFMDRGIASQILNVACPTAALRYYWRMKHTYAPDRRTTFTEEELPDLNPKLGSAISSQGYADRIDRCVAACHGRFLGGLDRFYLEERVASFMGNMLKLCEAHTQWRTPFLNNRWVDVVWRLGRRWKCGSNWHRYAVAENFPRLLEFPEQLHAPRWSRRAPVLYWRRKHKLPYISYIDPNAWYRAGPLRDFVAANAAVVDDLIAPKLVHRVLEAHASGERMRQRTLNFITTLIFWRLGQKPHQ